MRKAELAIGEAFVRCDKVLEFIGFMCMLARRMSE